MWWGCRDTQNWGLTNRLRVIHPLDPYQGPRFIELADDKDEPGGLDQLYTLTVGKREDYINPMAEGSVS